jgi:hypothetical protein
MLFSLPQIGLSRHSDRAAALTFVGEGTSKDDVIMALTYILWYGERRGGFDRPRVHWI